MKRTLPILLLLALLFPLCACGSKKTQSVAEERPVSAEGTYLGYLPREIPAPEGWGDIRDITLDSNRIYVTGRAQISEEEPVSGPVTVIPRLGVYQIAEDSWQQIPLPETARGEFRGISAKGGALWALLVDFCDNDFSFALVRYSEETDRVTIRQIGFDPAEGPIGYGFGGIVALDNNQAILYDEKNNYVINTEGKLLKTLPNTEGDLHCRMECGEQLYARCTKEGRDGFSCFNFASLTFEAFTPFHSQASDSGGFTSYGEMISSRCESERDSFLLCGKDGLYRFDRSGGSTERLSPWTDLALQARDLSIPKEVILEDQNGDLFSCSFGACLIKLHPAELQNKTPLRFACYGNCLLYQDAILRFNHTNPNYKIETVSFDQCTAGELERFRIELAAGYSYDIIDTALLPQDSADSSVLADLLPLIDSDPEYSREDFIQPILAGMMKEGGLYELIPNVTVLSMAASPDDYPGPDAWTMEAIAAIAADNGGKPMFSARWNREKLLDWFCLAASAEFVDWQNGTCSFDSELFRSWLRLIRDAPISGDLNEAVLLSPQYNAAAGPWPYLDELEGRYVLTGLPGASSPGYFMRLSDLPGDQADEIRLGISANSPYPEAAWEFLRIFLLPEYGCDIPILRACFETRLADMIGAKCGLPDTPCFSEEDAEKLRKLVETSTKMIRDKATLREMIRAEAAACLAGQRDPDETARLIQSRAAIYVAEQYG